MWRNELIHPGTNLINCKYVSKIIKTPIHNNELSLVQKAISECQTSYFHTHTWLRNML